LARSGSFGTGLLIFLPVLDVHLSRPLLRFAQLLHPLRVTHSDVGISGLIPNPAGIVPVLKIVPDPAPRAFPLVSTSPVLRLLV